MCSKKIFCQILLMSFIVLIGCSVDDDQTTNADTIIGVWQLIEKFDGGSPSQNQPVDNGKKLTFNDDGSFMGNSLESCTASYLIEENTITINASCREDIIRYVFDLKMGNCV